MKAAWLLVLAGVLAACGGSTGVRDAGKPPPVQATTHAVRLWFIRPGGRVGVERDLVPVTVQVRGFPNQLPRLAFIALEHGPTAVLRKAGYRSLVGCCSGFRERRGGGGPASRIKRRLDVRHIYAGWFDQTVHYAYFSRLQLASAMQIIRTLRPLPGVGGVEVMGVGSTYLRSMSAELARGRDRGLTRPVPEASCAVARRLPGSSVDVTSTGRGRVRVRVRATEPVSIEFSHVDGTYTDTVEATSAPCGVWKLKFPGAQVQFGRLVGTMAFQVRVTPLAGRPTPGVTQSFTLNAPAAIGLGA